jgi:hypothetical protein
MPFTGNGASRDTRTVGTRGRRYVSKQVIPRLSRGFDNPIHTYIGRPITSRDGGASGKSIERERQNDLMDNMSRRLWSADSVSVLKDGREGGNGGNGGNDQKMSQDEMVAVARRRSSPRNLDQ